MIYLLVAFAICNVLLCAVFTYVVYAVCESAMLRRVLFKTCTVLCVTCSVCVCVCVCGPFINRFGFIFGEVRDGVSEKKGSTSRRERKGGTFYFILFFFSTAQQKENSISFLPSFLPPPLRRWVKKNREKKKKEKTGSHK